MVRRNLWLVLSLVALLLGVPACGGPPARGDNVSGGDTAAAEREARAVEIAEARRASLVTTIEGAGIISGIREATVVTETEGKVTEVAFELGDDIEAGQVLVAFDSRRERSELSQAEGELELARIELAATESLEARGTASSAEVARRRAAVNGATARLAEARRRYEDRTVRSPISGRVAEKPIDLEVGAYRARGVQIARVIDTERLRSEIGVGQRQVAYVRPGAEAEVRVPVCSDLWRPAEVTAIGAGSDRRTGSFPVRVEWENPCQVRVRAGMSVQVRIKPVGAERQLVLPSEAVVRRAGRTYVYRVTADRAEQREIEITERFADRVAITGDVAEGDMIITSALSALRDGDRVRPNTAERPEP